MRTVTPRYEHRTSERGRISKFIPTEPHAVYRIYRADGILLYIGMSSDPEYRIRRHRTEQSWGGEIATWTVEWHDDRRTALRAEQPAIDTELPCYGMTTDLYREVSEISRRSEGKQERIAAARARYRQYAIAEQLTRRVGEGA